MDILFDCLIFGLIPVLLLAVGYFLTFMGPLQEGIDSTPAKVIMYVGMCMIYGAYLMCASTVVLWAYPLLCNAS